LLNLQGDNANGYTSAINIGIDLTDMEVGASDSMGQLVEVHHYKHKEIIN
jgi:hypothetical protein